MDTTEEPTRDEANESSKLEAASNSNTIGEAIPGTNATLADNTAGVDSSLTPEQTQVNAEIKKLGGFPSDLSSIKPLFSLKSKNDQAKERFTQKASDYLDSHKMSIYL